MFVLVLCVLIMCLHLNTDRKLSNLFDKYENASLDEFNNCDYVNNVTDVQRNDLVVMQLNVRGIGSKKSQLIDLVDNSVHNKQPDVLLMGKTWLTPFSPRLDIPGYELYRQDHVHKKSGGVAILVSSKLCCTDRPDLASKLEESECMTIEIKLKNGDCCLVSSMYHPPNSDTSTFLASYNLLICAMKKEKPKGIIIGLPESRQAPCYK